MPNPNLGLLWLFMTTAHATVPAKNTECKTCISCINYVHHQTIGGQGIHSQQVSFKTHADTAWNYWNQKSECAALTSKYSNLRTQISNQDSPSACASASICVCSSSTCNGAATDWTAIPKGHDNRQEYKCDSYSYCTTSYVYRCSAGYYGTASGSTYGTCTQCPDNGTSSPGSTSQTACYILSGSDLAGTFKFSGTCYYKP